MKKKLLYSFSNGEYWSSYNSCGVWENGNYTVMVKDKYNQIARTDIVISNIIKRMLPLPIIDSLGYIERSIAPGDVTLRVSSPEADTFVYISVDNGISWSLLDGDYVCTHSQNILFQLRDSYGNKGKILTYIVYIDKTPPTNINYNPIVVEGGDINTEINVIEDSNFPVKYSISYDNGATWSPFQYGRYFKYFQPSNGTYNIICKAINAAGLIVEGQPVSITINRGD